MKFSTLIPVLLLAQPVLEAATATVTVPANAGPWLVSLNPAFSYTWAMNFAPPTVVNATNGISFSAGGQLTVTYVSGLADGHDANGDTNNVTNFSDGGNGRFPGFYMNPGPPAYGGALVGTFANNGVITGVPFMIGNGPTILTIPAGATELLLGNNDNYFADNVGHYVVNVTSLDVPRYNICPLYDASKAVKSGSTLPVKLQLCNASAANLSSPNLAMHAVNTVLVSTQATQDVRDAGSANPDDDFRFDATIGGTGGYIFNLSTKGLNTGTYKLNFTVTGDSFVYFVPFQIR